MPTYAVKRTLIVHADVTVLIEADSPDEADGAIFDLIPSNIGMPYSEAGWKATVEVRPPKDVMVQSKRLRSTWIDHTDTAAGSKGAKPKRVSA